MNRGKNTVSTKNEFQWEPLPETDFERLAKNLQNRARSDDELRFSIGECRQHTKKVLQQQENTCLLAGGESKYCWNEPRDQSSYLKLQWSHKTPISHGPKPNIDNFVLLCARCNNKIQSSRTFEQLEKELNHKICVLRKILSKSNGT